jgi:hypothetical protein
VGACFEWEGGECTVVDVDEYDVDGLLTIPKAAVRLGDSVQEVVAHIMAGRLAAMKCRGVWVINESDISRFLGGY